MQELGVRLPIYPTLPSISEINANNFFNIGDNLEASFYRPGIEISDRIDVEQGEAQPAVRRRAAALHGRDPQPVPPCGALPVRRQHDHRHRQYARRFPARPAQPVRPGHRRVQGLRRELRVAVRPGRLPGESARLTLNLGARLESTPPWHEKDGRIEVFSLADYQNNVHSTVFPQAPRGETFRGDPGVPEDGTERVGRITSGPASASRGTSPATARPACAAAAARSTISTATANPATARSTRRRGTCACQSSGRPARSRIRIAGGTTST